MATKKSANTKDNKERAQNKSASSGKTEGSENNQNKSLYRSANNKIIAGVCGGLGQYFDIDPTIIRIVFVLMTVFGGSGLLIYLILWLVIPSETSGITLSQDHIKENAKEMKQKAETFAHDIRKSSSNKDSRPWWGVVIVILGAFFLMSNYGLFDFYELRKLWPLALIVLGILILLRK